MQYEIKNTTLRLYDEDNIEINIKRIPRAQLATFSEKYDTILERLLEANGSIGTFLAVNKNYNLLNDLCKIIPTLEEPHHLLLDKIEDDYILLTQLFYSESINKETLLIDVKDNESLKPSLITRFNFMEYEQRLGKIAMKVRSRVMKEIENQMKEIEMTTPIG